MFGYVNNDQIFDSVAKFASISHDLVIVARQFIEVCLNSEVYSFGYVMANTHFIKLIMTIMTICR